MYYFYREAQSSFVAIKEMTYQAKVVELLIHYAHDVRTHRYAQIHARTHTYTPHPCTHTRTNTHMYTKACSIVLHHLFVGAEYY